MSSHNHWIRPIYVAVGLLVGAHCPMVSAGSDGDALAITEYPFSKGSIWNTPIGSRAIYQADRPGNETSLIRDPDPLPDGGKPHAYLWLGRDAMQVFHASRADPLVHWHYERRPQYLAWPFPDDKGSYYRGGDVNLRTPHDFVGQTVDGWGIVFDPTDRYYLETWQPKITRENGKISRIDVSFLALNDACGTGFPNEPAIPGRHDGIRAPGISLLGGLLRKREIEEGVIPHAIAMVLSQWQLKSAATQAEQIVWPAYHADGDSVANYRGGIPMGSLFAISAKTDLHKIGIKTREGMILATAYQDYGGYAVDTADDTFTIASLEKGVDGATADALQKDIGVIRDNLSLVSNNAASARAAADAIGAKAPVPVGGGGTPLVTPRERGCPAKAQAEKG